MGLVLYLSSQCTQRLLIRGLLLFWRLRVNQYVRDFRDIRLDTTHENVTIVVLDFNVPHHNVLFA